MDKSIHHSETIFKMLQKINTSFQVSEKNKRLVMRASKRKSIF